MRVFLDDPAMTATATPSATSTTMWASRECGLTIVDVLVSQGFSTGVDVSGLVAPGMRSRCGENPVGRSIEPVISITTKSPYALRALAELGRSGDGPVPIGDLARRRDIPVQFLEQLFAVLRRAGVLRSQRGVKGGYSFARPPAEITALEIVELLDGPLGRDADGIFADAAAAARDVLARTTIADVIAREAAEAGAAMYYI